MRKFIRAFQSKAVSRTMGRFALYTFFLTVVMTFIAIFSAVVLRTELTGIFDIAGMKRSEQVANHHLLADLTNARGSLLYAVLTKDAAQFSEFRALLSNIKQADGRIKMLRGQSDSVYSDFDKRVTSSVELLQVAAAMDLKSADSEPFREVLGQVIHQIEAARGEQLRIDAILSAQLTAMRDDGRKAVFLLIVSLAFLAVGLTLSSFAQLRELVLQTACFLSDQEKSSHAIESLEKVVVESKMTIDSVSRQLSVTLRSAGIQVVTINRDGLVDWAADDQSRFAALNQAPFMLPDLVLAEDRAKLHQTIADVIASSQPASIELHLTEGIEGGEGDVWVRLQFVAQADTDPLRALVCVIDISELKRREQSTFWLLRELSHRSKNLLAVIQSIARQTARTSQSPSDFIERLSDRLKALAASHDLLVNADYTAAPLDKLIRSQLFLLSELIGKRVMLDGPDVSLSAEAAQNLGMALHELCANAITHGALKKQGLLDIRWFLTGVVPAEMLVIEWVESTTLPPQPVRPPGFGIRLITTHLSRALGAEVTINHLASGTVCHMKLPMDRVKARNAPPVA